MQLKSVALYLLALSIVITLLAAPGTAGSALAADSVRVVVARTENSVEFAAANGGQVVEQATGRVVAAVGAAERWQVEQREGRLFLYGAGQSYGPFSGTLALRASSDTVQLVAEGGYLIDAPSLAGLSALAAGGNLVNLTAQDRVQALSATGRSELTASAGLNLITLSSAGYSYRYRGEMLFLVQEDLLLAVNRLDLEDYLRGVVASEMPSTWPEEALKAQAVASRTYALQRAGEARNEAYDLTGDQYSQMYTGYDGEVPATNQAIQATAGVVLRYNGEPIQAFFHSSSGGFTENSEDVWLDPLPYIKAKIDPYDLNENHYNWQVTYNPGQLLERLADYGEFNSITDLNCTYTASGARIREMTVSGLDYANNPLEIKIANADRVRAALGLKSALVTVDKTYGLDNRLAWVSFSGSGFGHGLGMSQYGARGMALLGYDYREILQYYFTDITLTGAY